MSARERPRSAGRAVALSYDGGTGAPVVVASGMGYMAEKIVEVAAESGVPVYEDNSLATMLSQLALGQEIPDSLYRAIVEIYVYFLNFDPADPDKARRQRNSRPDWRKERIDGASVFDSGQGRRGPGPGGAGVPADHGDRAAAPDGGDGSGLPADWGDPVHRPGQLRHQPGTVTMQRGERLVVKPIATLGEDARENLRIQTDFESVMYPITGYWKGQRAVKGHDLSCGGVAFHTPQALRPGEVVQVVLPVTDSPLLLRAKVLRELDAEAPDRLYAARFVDLCLDEEMAIRKAVFEIQVSKPRAKT